MAYIIHELQNRHSVRQGTIYNGTLRTAKSKATRDQMFQGTFLKITNERGITVATKASGGQWQAYDDSGIAQNGFVDLPI